MKHALRFAAILLAVLASSPVPTVFGTPAQESPPALVVLDIVEEKMVAESTPVVGTLYFDQASTLAPEVAGVVASVRVRAGDRVKRGDILLTLNTDFTDQEIALVRNRIALTKIQMEKAAKDLERFAVLLREDATSEKAYEDILYARQELEKQHNAYTLELATARLKKDKSSLRAPYDGIVLEKMVDAGTYAAPGSPCFRIGALQEIYVQVPVAEDLVRYARPGETTDVTINALNQELTGTYEGFVPVADRMTRNILLKVKIPVPDQVVENMSATVQVAVAKPRMLKLVPRDALVKLQGQDFVYTVKDGQSAPLPVEILAFTGTKAAVASEPLQAGMQVVVDGAQRLRPDQPVQVIDR